MIKKSLFRSSINKPNLYFFINGPCIKLRTQIISYLVLIQPQFKIELPCNPINVEFSDATPRRGNFAIRIWRRKSSSS